MLVYGDHIREGDPRTEVRSLERTLDALVGLPPNLARHAALVGAFIHASELAQGLADAEAEATAIDARGLASDVAMSLLVALGHQIATSWRSRFSTHLITPHALSVLHELPLPEHVRMRRAEGHAYYAVYPEAYLKAASTALARRPGPRQVIGIRSIGTGLAAIVAAAQAAPLPATVRPRGEPYRRQLHVGRALAAEWTRDPGVTFSVVDEGPGISGSSFGAVADALEDRGVAPDRIECFPSHDGQLGPIASERHRTRWLRVRRHVVDVDQLLITSNVLAGWIAELVGPLTAPLQDLSAGSWRAVRYADESVWPASVTFQERRKLLARTADGAWLARFVGLGRAGTEALDRARALHAAGMTPQVAGLCHGFLIERWHEDAAPLDPRRCDRERLIAHVGRYLAVRGRRLPARQRGASLARLLEMARYNTGRALGTAMSAALERYSACVPRLEQSMQAIEVDGRLHAWEWLVRPDGSFLKTDALDHHAAHDLIGCQDITWDLAGAATELELSPDEERRLRDVTTAHAGRPHDPELLQLMHPCYLAFQIGRHELAIDSVDRSEAARLRSLVDRYAARLMTVLAS